MGIIDDISDLLTDSVSIRTFSGRDDYGRPSYSVTGTYQARVVQRHSLVRDQQGDEVVSTAEIWINGYPELTNDDQILLSDGSVSDILAIERYQDHHGPSHVKIKLK